MSFEQEYLTFLLDDTEFGIDILCVQEIRVWSDVTTLPNKPEYIKGVINLRGTIIPIIDLRIRFSKEPLEYNEQTVTIILKSRDTGRSNAVGIVVDAVSEVYKFDSKSIREPPAFGGQIDKCFLKGLAAVEEKLIVLLDAAAVLNEDDLYTLSPIPIEELASESDNN